MGNICVVHYKGKQIIGVKNGVKVKGDKRVYKTLSDATDSLS